MCILLHNINIFTGKIYEFDSGVLITVKVHSVSLIDFKSLLATKIFSITLKSLLYAG